MTHEMLISGGVTLGIRSWSDFWLNEGLRSSCRCYIEKHLGRAAYDKQIAELQERMKKLCEEGKDRPLHWEKWKGRRMRRWGNSYVKGHCSWTAKTELARSNRFVTLRTHSDLWTPEISSR